MFVFTVFFAISCFVLSIWASGPHDITKDLGPELSSNAKIITKDNAEFPAGDARWDEVWRPEFYSRVEVANEDDIVKIMKWANTRKIPYLATAGGHGSIHSLTKLRHGVHISTKQMNAVITEGNVVTIQAGASSLDVISTLWDQGKQTVTGAAECTAYMGVVLGGGHNTLQGRYGLGVDNMLEARVILANGSIVHASENSNPDLFWALRGAGHNFGIVTEIKAKSWDIDTSSTWYFETTVFLAHQFGDFVKAFYELVDNQPDRLLFAGVIARVPAIDPVKPVVLLTFIFDGPSDDLEPHVQAFRDMHPIPLANGTVPYRNLASTLDQNEAGANCLRNGHGRLRFPMYVNQRKDEAAMQGVFDIYDETTRKEPGLNGSVILMEVAARQAVIKVPLESTAVPLRDHGAIIMPLIDYVDRKLDHQAREFGEELRQQTKKVTGEKKIHAYVNYASGFEKSEEIYGHEKWRLQKLRVLKSTYDPDNQFGFYAPIEPKVGKDEL